MLLDQEALRNEVSGLCAHKMKELERLQAELNGFKDRDKPAYTQWIAANFGPILTELREIGTKLIEKSELAYEVEQEVFESACSYRKAYAIVMERRSNPSFQDPFSDPSSGDREFPPRHGADSAQATQEDEDAEAFESALREYGLHPGDLDPDQYEEMFSTFRRETLRRHSSARPEGPSPARVRLKELYRLLVRRLHPDTRADSDPKASALWHEVQEAYETANLPRMEMLAAMTEDQAGAIHSKTPLSQLRMVVEELERGIRELATNIRRSKSEPAWNFSRLRNLSRLKRTTQTEMELTLEGQRWMLADLERLIAEWSKPPRPRKRKNPPRPTKEKVYGLPSH